MPLYEYECDANRHRFEVIQKFSDPPVETCPTCGSTVHKLMSSPAIQFKGTGWYVTDYARKAGDGKDAGKEPRDAKDAGESKDKDPKGAKDAKETKSESAAKPEAASKAPSPTRSTSGTSAKD
jgi:putative FmdB family regulatory protein